MMHGTSSHCCGARGQMHRAGGQAHGLNNPKRQRGER